MRRIAAGGMGEVWEAQDEVLGRRVAAKVIQSTLAGDAHFSTRFRHEAQLSARLSHPAIATVHDFGRDDGVDYLVMELVRGESLADLIARHGALAPAYAADLIRQAATGLAAAHEAGVIHRDVKPANILVTPNGQVKVTDFGIARALGEAAMTRTGEVLGTAQYLSPEAALGREVGPQSDLYSLAVVTYEALCGRRPFHADSGVTLALQHVNTPPPGLPPGLPPALQGAVMRGLAKQPDQRQPGVVAFADDVMRAAHPVAGGPQPVHSWPTQSVTPPPGPPIYGKPPAPAAPPSPAAPWFGRLWVGLAVLTVLCTLLPWASYADQHWIAYTLADASHLTADDSNGTGSAVAATVFAAVFGALGVPQALGKGRLGCTVPALFVGVFSGVVWLACVAYIDGTTDEPSRLSMGVGAILFPILGTAAFAFAVAALFRRR